MTTLYALAALFLVILCILWVCLPFAVFGIKDRLDKLIKQNAEIVRQNSELIRGMK